MIPSASPAHKPITIAILAMGGQGGGVLADWVVALAESQNWVAQSTSVPGVAQRTGATIYYVEMGQMQDARLPVLSLTPTPGDVDIVLAAEFMEAGRSMLRGLVTPDRTTLIASTHRSYAVGEKEVPGDGTGDPQAVADAFAVAARRSIMFDMQSLADRNSSVISSVMFGALAGAGVLPFGRNEFEAAIRAGGRGVDASLRAFEAGFDAARANRVEPVAKGPAKQLVALPDAARNPQLNDLLTRIRVEFPDVLHPMLFAGLQRLVDFQDARYGGQYLDILAAQLGSDRAAGGGDRHFAFTQQAAKYLAVAMAYDDVIRVADLKIRGTRFDRVRQEVGAGREQIVYTTEYMHPRVEEVIGALPTRLGLFVERHPKTRGFLDRLFNKGRRVRTGTIGWFLMLYALSGLKPLRRTMLRHQREFDHIQAWLATANSLLAMNYDLATEVIACRRLIKGYSDTHSRGEAKFDRVMKVLPLLGDRQDGALWLRRLVQSALQDEAGKALDGAIETLRSVAEPVRHGL